MDVDNNQPKLDTRNNAPLDASGQLTQPMRTEMKQMIKSQKTTQWPDGGLGNQPKMSFNQNYGTQDSQNQFRGSDV